MGSRLIQGFQEGAWEGWGGAQGFSSGGMDLNHWVDGAWAESSWQGEAWGEGDSQEPAESGDVIRNFRLKKDRKYSVDNWQEWVREEKPEVVEAVQAAVVAETKIQAGLNDEADIKANLEQLEIAREAYRLAFKAAFTEEFKRQWLEDLARYRFEIKRRAALLLLLS